MRELLTGFVMTNTNDSGSGSLRQPITSAIGAAAQNVIIFAIRGSGPHIITPLSALPTITNALMIDGTSQPGYSSTPLIELNGSGTGGSEISITADICVIKGMAIGNFQTGNNLISGKNILVQVNFVGTDTTGMVDPPPWMLPTSIKVLPTGPP